MGDILTKPELAYVRLYNFNYFYYKTLFNINKNSEQNKDKKNTN